MQKQITCKPWSGYGEARAHLPGIRPEHFARGGIERVHGLWVPENELPGASGIDHRGRAVARFACIQRTPNFFAAVFVKRDRHATRSAAETDQALAIEQRMSGEAPHGRLRSIFGFEIVRPEHLAVCGVETEEVSLCAKRPHFAAAHHRGTAWAGGVAHGVGAVVAMLPHESTRLCIQTQHAFATGNDAPREGITGHAAFFGHLTVHEIHPAIRNRRTGVTTADLHTPEHLGATCWKSLDDAGLTPDAVTLRAEPLRPVFGAKNGGEHEQDKKWRAHGQTNSPA